MASCCRWRKMVKCLQVMLKGPVSQRPGGGGHHEHRPAVRFEPRNLRHRGREHECRHVGGRPPCRSRPRSSCATACSSPPPFAREERHYKG